MNAPSVIHVNSVAEQAQYRNAVAEIIRDIQHDHKCKLEDIAEAINVTVATISNSVNRKSDLSAVFLQRLGRVYGGAYLNPWLRSIGVQAAPIDGSIASDILPMMMMAAQKIAAARDPAGPGGVVEVPQEKAAYLPDLKRLQNRNGHLIREVEMSLA